MSVLRTEVKTSQTELKCFPAWKVKWGNKNWIKSSCLCVRQIWRQMNNKWSCYLLKGPSHSHEAGQDFIFMDKSLLTHLATKSLRALKNALFSAWMKVKIYLNINKLKQIPNTFSFWQCHSHTTISFRFGNAAISSSATRWQWKSNNQIAMATVWGVSVYRT